MGDRVSVAFRNGKNFRDEVNDSVVLFNHWGGKSTPNQALKYAKMVKEHSDNRENQNCHDPIDRLEPETLMVGFICYLWNQGAAKGKNYNSKMEYVETGLHNDNLYLGATQNDGDNSDNGHYIVDLQQMKLIRC